MNNNESNSIINFHNLAIELRRLKRQPFAISTAALLINQSVTQTSDYSTLLQHPDSQALSDLCNIICYRFSTDPSSDIINLISLLRFTQGPQQIGPWFLLNTLFLIYHNNLNENCLKALNQYDPIYLEKYLLGQIYSDPKNLFRASSYELFLPLQVPNLARLTFNERANSSLLQYLIYYSFSRSSAHIEECASDEKLFDSFTNFVFNNPDFFIVANQIFKKKNLTDILLKLKNKNPSNLLNSYLLVYYNTSHEIAELFFNLYNDTDFLKYVNNDHIENLYNFLKSNDKWDLISQLYRRDDESRTILSNIFQTSFLKDQSKYLSKYSNLKYDFLIEPIEPILLNPENQIDTQYFIYFLANDNITLKMLRNEPHFLKIIYENSLKKSESNKKTIDQIVSFINRNLSQFIETQHMGPPNLLFSEDSIVHDLMMNNELLFFDIFDSPSTKNIMEETLVALISFISQSMNQGMAPQAQQMEGQTQGQITAVTTQTSMMPDMMPPAALPAERGRGPGGILVNPIHRMEIEHRRHHHQNLQQQQQQQQDQNQPLLKFPSVKFFEKMVEKVDVDQVLSRIYKESQELMRIVEWRNALVAVPRLLFSTLRILSVMEPITDSNELINIFQKYLMNSYDKFSKSSTDFLQLVHFFLDYRLLSVIPQFMFQNLSLSIRLLILECFANCAHLIFENDPKSVDTFISFFDLIAKTDVFKVASPSNDLLCRDFVLSLYREAKYEAVVPKMIIELNTSPPQPLTAKTSDFVGDENDCIVSKPPSLENLSVNVGSDADGASLAFITDFLRGSMPDVEAIGHMLQSDMMTLRKLAELSVKSLAHVDCSLWTDEKFLQSFALIVDKLDEFPLRPRFLQSLAFYVDRYCGRMENINPHAHSEIHPNLAIYYRVIASASMKSSAFENVLGELLE